MIASPLDSASHWLNWSNIIYVGGAALTVIAAMWVLYEARAVATGKREKYFLVSEFFAAGAAIISLIGTIGAIHFSNKVGQYKDADLKTYQTQAQVQIQQAKTDAAKAVKDAAVANQKAQEAGDHAAIVDAQNIALGGQVGKDAATARAAEAALDAKNKETSDFAHSLQQQQGVMAEQAKVSPQLTDFQIQQLAILLKPYAGSPVDINQTAETVVGRLASAIHAAFNIAGVKTNHRTMMGALYQGVSVGVHAPTDVPPIANALVMGLRQAGVDVHPVAVPDQVKAGGVTIFVGPN